MPSPEDDRLLERLGLALGLASSQPSFRQVQRVRTATDEHAALRRAVQALGQSLLRRRPIEVARHSAEVRSHLRRWEAMLGLQPADAIVTEARQLLRQSRRFIRSRHRRQVGPDGLTSSFL